MKMSANGIRSPLLDVLLWQGFNLSKTRKVVVRRLEIANVICDSETFHGHLITMRLDGKQTVIEICKFTAKRYFREFVLTLKSNR